MLQLPKAAVLGLVAASASAVNSKVEVSKETPALGMMDAPAIPSRISRGDFGAAALSRATGNESSGVAVVADPEKTPGLLNELAVRMEAVRNLLESAPAKGGERASLSRYIQKFAEATAPDDLPRLVAALKRGQDEIALRPGSDPRAILDRALQPVVLRSIEQVIKRTLPDASLTVSGDKVFIKLSGQEFSGKLLPNGSFGQLIGTSGKTTVEFSRDVEPANLAWKASLLADFSHRMHAMKIESGRIVERPQGDYEVTHNGDTLVLTAFDVIKLNKDGSKGELLYSTVPGLAGNGLSISVSSPGVYTYVDKTGATVGVLNQDQRKSEEFAVPLGGETALTAVMCLREPNGELARVMRSPEDNKTINEVRADKDGNIISRTDYDHRGRKECELRFDTKTERYFLADGSKVAERRYEKCPVIEKVSGLEGFVRAEIPRADEMSKLTEITMFNRSGDPLPTFHSMRKIEAGITPDEYLRHVAEWCRLPQGGTDPVLLNEYLNHALRYEADGARKIKGAAEGPAGLDDYWQTPAETILRTEPPHEGDVEQVSVGDCDDTAIFAQEIRRLNGEHSLVVIVPAHAVNVAVAGADARFEATTIGTCGLDMNGAYVLRKSPNGELERMDPATRNLTAKEKSKGSQHSSVDAAVYGVMYKYRDLAHASKGGLFSPGSYRSDPIGLTLAFTLPGGRRETVQAAPEVAVRPELYAVYKTVAEDRVAGRWNDALTKLTTLRQEQPRNVSLAYEQGVTALRAKKYDAALSYFKEADVLSPNNRVIEAAMAHAYLGVGNEAEFSRIMRYHLTQDPRRHTVLVDLANSINSDRTDWPLRDRVVQLVEGYLEDTFRADAGNYERLDSLTARYHFNGHDKKAPAAWVEHTEGVLKKVSDAADSASRKAAIKEFFETYRAAYKISESHSDKAASDAIDDIVKRYNTLIAKLKNEKALP